MHEINLSIIISRSDIANNVAPQKVDVDVDVVVGIVASSSTASFNFFGHSPRPEFTSYIDE